MVKKMNSVRKAPAEGGTITCLCTNIRMVSRSIARSYDSALAPSGLNSIQYSILAQIARFEPIGQVKLARRLEMERTTLYRALDILIRDDLLETADENDGSKTVRLSSHGRSVSKRAHGKWEQIHRVYLEKIGVEKMELLLKTLIEVRAIDGSL